MSLLLARRSQPCPWVQIMSFWVNRLIFSYLTRSISTLLPQTVWAYYFQPQPSFDLSLKWWIDCFFDRAYDIVYIWDRSGWSRAFVFPFLIWTSIPHSIHQEALLALVIWVIFFMKGQERTPQSILHYRNRPSPPLHHPTSSYRVRDLMLRSKK